MPTALRSRHSTASFAVVCGQCYADKSTDRDKANADAIINNGRMPSSPIWGFSRCPKPTDWRANPDVETTDWRARRGRTAHRVRREGTAQAVPYPYPNRIMASSPLFGDIVHRYLRARRLGRFDCGRFFGRIRVLDAGLGRALGGGFLAFNARLRATARVTNNASCWRLASSCDCKSTIRA